MKKYILFAVTLFSVTAFSFSSVFDDFAVAAAGGLAALPCNGSDISELIQCGQVAGASACLSPSYKTVLDGQPHKDELSTKTDQCMTSGCVNKKDTPTPAEGKCNPRDVTLDP